MEYSDGFDTVVFKIYSRSRLFMLGSLGAKGLLGVLVLLAGIALIATADLRIAGGIALVLVGLGLAAWGLVVGLLESMGMGGMLSGEWD